MEAFVTVLCVLFIVHALCDYPLQGDFLSRAKNVAAPIPGIPWWWAMGAHAAIHAGGVWIVTGHPVLGLMEFGLHFAIDGAKCNGKLTFSQDQAIHLLTKLWPALCAGCPWWLGVR